MKKSLIVNLLFSFSIFANYIDLKNVIKDYYNSFAYMPQKLEQSIKIKEHIKKLEENEFILNKEDIKSLELINKQKIDLKEKVWKIEKLYFVEWQNIIWLSPEPKLPRDYFNKEVKFQEEKHNYVLEIKMNPFFLELGRSISQPWPMQSYNFKFDVELFLYLDYTSEKIIEKAIEKVFYKIYFIQDFSPLNTFERKIKVYGYIKEVI